MHIQLIDWAIIIVFLIISFSISFVMSKKAGRSTSDFFLSGRNLPWYIAGTSMVATTFAADTPLAVTELVAQKGIAGNWLWWNMLLGGMLTVFFFSRLWRRAEILTDAEFVSIRYSGAEANFLRGFRSIYIGIGMNIIVMAWVNLAMVKIMQVMFPDFTLFGLQEFYFMGIRFSSHLLLVALLILFTAVYSSLSGLRGVSITDTFQFVLAMTGCIILAVIAVDHVGGIDNLKNKLSDVKWVFDFFPDINGSTNPSSGSATGLLKMGVIGIIAYLGVQWWASWYPGAEPGGGGYIAQRMMSAKDEKNSLLATLWFQVAHFALRPWPWIIVALVTLVMYPNEPDKGATYVMVIRDLLPPGLTGLLLAAFLAAFMSTIASQTVWGTSYIINDFLKPFVKKGADEKYYVKASRITTFLLLFLSVIVTTQFERISDAWKFILALSAGIGPVLLLRWFWWRINAWSEISAMVAPYLIFPVLKYGLDLDIIGLDYELSLILIVIWSTIVWLSVTFLTKPSDLKKLEGFYSKVHPGGAGWKRIAKNLPQIKGDGNFSLLFVNYILGCIMVMLALFGIGKIIFREYGEGIVYIFGAILALIFIYRNLSKSGWSKIVK